VACQHHDIERIALPACLWAITDIGNIGKPGSINDDKTSHTGHIGKGIDGRYDGQTLWYNYSFGDFGFAISVEQDDTGTVDDGFAVGAKYSVDMVGVGIYFGLGYQEVTFSALITSGMLALMRPGDGLSVHVNHAELDSFIDRDGYGAAVAYGLGGGASVKGGEGSGTVGTDPTTDSWSLGF
jgi:outer membrane protein OmpU